MHKRTREILKLCRTNSLSIISMDSTSRGGWRLHVKAPNGAEKQFYLLLSPDNAVAHREQKAIAAFAIENPLPAIAQAFIKAKTPAQPKEPDTMTLNTTPAASPKVEAPAKPKPGAKGSGEYTKAALTHERFFKLCTWLQATMKDEPERLSYTQIRLAGLAAEALGFPVSPSSVGAACNAAGIRLTSPQAKSGKTPPVSREDFITLVLMVNVIRTDAGVKATPEFSKLLLATFPQVSL